MAFSSVAWPLVRLVVGGLESRERSMVAPPAVPENGVAGSRGGEHAGFDLIPPSSARIEPGTRSKQKQGQRYFAGRHDKVRLDPWGHRPAKPRQRRTP